MLALHIPLPYQRANKASSHQVASSAASRLIPQSSNSACCMCGCRCRYHTQLCSAVGVNRHFSSHHLIVLIHMCCAELRAWRGRWWWSAAWCPRKWRRLCLALALIIYAVWPFRIWMATPTHTHTPKHNSFRFRIASRKSFQFLSYLLLGGSGRFYGMMLTAFFKLTEAGIV
jgi:hypothetical protein